MGKRSCQTTAELPEPVAVTISLPNGQIPETVAELPLTAMVMDESAVTGFPWGPPPVRLKVVMPIHNPDSAGLSGAADPQANSEDATTTPRMAFRTGKGLTLTGASGAKILS